MDEMRKHIKLIETAAQREALAALLPAHAADLFDVIPGIDNPDFLQEAANALQNICGAFIGHGTWRAVYEHKHNPQLVVKIEGLGRPRFMDISDFKAPYCNAAEAKNWRQAQKHPAIAEWFAPLFKVSPKSDWVILMRRTAPVAAADMPKQLPAFFSEGDELMLDNWGLLDGRVVCHDYGLRRMAGWFADPAQRRLVDIRIENCGADGDRIIFPHNPL